MPRSSTECSTSSLPTARCRRTSTARTSRSSRRAIPSHGDLATNAAMVLAKAAGTNPRALAEAIKPKLAALPPVTSVEIAGPGLHQHPPDARRLARRAAHDPARRRRLRPLDDRRQRAGQRRICLGQPDRAAAHGPLPRRGGRRQPCAPARGGGLPGHQGILCQRRRRAGRYARPLGAPALPRGARRGDRRNSRGPLSRRLSEAGRRRCSPRNMATDMPTRPRASGSALFRERGDRGDARPHPPRPRACSASTTTVRVRGRGAAHRRGRPRRWQVLRGKGLVYEGELERPKSLDRTTNGSRSS